MSDMSVGSCKIVALSAHIVVGEEGKARTKPLGKATQCVHQVNQTFSSQKYQRAAFPKQTMD
ncbi:hypothetical protein N7445_005962 [Penicillium cf. griseofulvum]|nr:hypothetical protein N7445_005962 [Penicillium cf. griseofulvum]